MRFSSKSIEESQKDFLTKREKARNDANKRPCSDSVMVQCIKCKVRRSMQSSGYIYNIYIIIHNIIMEEVPKWAAAQLYTSIIIINFNK